MSAAFSLGRLIGVSGSTMYLGFADTLPRLAFRHIDYLVQLIGPDHVGLGTDYIVDAQATARILSARPDEWPHDDLTAPLDYMPPEALSDLVAEMERAAYDEDSIAKILGGNYLRIAEAVWK